MAWKHVFFVLIYFATFAGTAVGMIWWQRRQRKMRKPFGDDFRLLRGPGETQFKIVQKLDEDLPLWIVLLSLIPSTIGLLLLKLTVAMPGVVQLVGLALTVAGFAAAFYFAARLLAGRLRQSADRYLGYFGERIVAEHLEPLKGQGWRVLHDVPFQNNGTKFNLDHITIGPQGVFAIETKTRRKGGARPGFDDHKVFFDGRDLEWPWGNDNHGLEQAERNAVELARVIKDETGERVHVSPILTLPGWFVEPRPSRDSRMCRVTNPKGLSKFLPSGPAVLDAAKIAAIATKLEARCRDVEY